MDNNIPCFRASAGCKLITFAEPLMNKCPSTLRILLHISKNCGGMPYSEALRTTKLKELGTNFLQLPLNNFQLIFGTSEVEVCRAVYCSLFGVFIPVS